MRYFRTGNTDWLAALPLVLCLEANAQAPLPICNAPIVLDGSTPGTVLGNNQITIQGGLLSGDGTNLFHNLSCFNVPTNGSATFQNPAQGINNVVARVTGGELSTIGGDLNTRLGPTGSGRASVFLLNPNGVLFNGNTNANLNSLVVSTANSIGFDGGATLTPGSTAQDLVAVTGDPIHFGNLDATAKVTFDGARVMMTNQGDLVLVAKDVELGNGSRIITEGAQVVVAAAGGGNSVTLDVRDRNTLPTFDQPATGNVEVAGSSGISTSHASGGRIVIRGGVLTLTNTNPNQAALNVADAGGDPGVGIDIEATQRVTLSRSQISTGTSFSGTASDIRISAPLIQMDSESAGVNTSAIRTNGRGGDIHIEASSELNIRDGEISTIVTGGSTGGNIAVDTERLTITDRSSILSLVQSGTGGNIRVNVGEDITIDGKGATRPLPDGSIIPESVGIIANTVGTGQGGEISVEAKGDIILRNGGLIDSSSFSRGNAGKISVQAQNLSIDGENFAFATGITSFTVNRSDPNAGRGGDIGVNVPGSITLLNGGEIDTSSFGAGDAGRISIGMSDASTSLAIDKGTATRFTGIGSDASGSGDAGEVAIRTGALSIANGGQISTGVFFSEMVPFSGIGNGGDVNVFADSLRVSGTSPGGDDGTSIVPNSAIFAGTQAGTSGKSGTVTISASGSIDMTAGALVGVESSGSGEAGTLLVSSGSDINLAGGSGFTVASAEADAGNISLSAIGNIVVSESTISARAGVMGDADATGSGGNVLIDGMVLALVDDSTITAQAVRGSGGNINIATDYLFVNDPESQINASSEFGVDGEVSVDSVMDLSENIPQLEAEVLADTDQVGELDPSKVPGDQSTFNANAGRGGIPLDPGGYMPSLDIWDLPPSE